jgi:hypothetical protein
MSRAFVKESDQDQDSLPERTVSAHANFVTARGLALLEQSIQALELERTTARWRALAAICAISSGGARVRA